MIVSPGRRYIFVHIPKTGGTSLAAALEARAMKDDILIGDTPKAVRRRGRLKGLSARGRLWKHATLADIEGVLPDDVLSDCLVVTLVRNPWDRMVSYYHWLQAQSFAHPAVALSKDLPFAGFLAHPTIRTSIASAPYASYVTGSTGLEAPTLFLRLETLADDIGAFEDHLGFALEIGHENASARAADWRSYYDDMTAALVAEDCATDIARFGYRFDP
ncbi:Type II secretory pathway, pullulanase PulA [Litorisediminicola beolgyonensis]|uniref:Type II secretory pathway, pullulanase PulA n=1 Tax=Litorisediminicola beolgyonensis TaxID=1173614 RepID=A0ABW3ZMA6_9RHOB